MASARSVPVLVCAFACVSVWVTACHRDITVRGAQSHASWPQPGGDSGHTGFATVAGPEQPKIVWSWEPPAEEPAGTEWQQGIVAGPVVAADGTVYVATSGRGARLWAIGSDGAVRWQLPIGQDGLVPAPRNLILDARDAPVLLCAGRLVRVHPCGAIESAPEVYGSRMLLGPDSVVYVDGLSATDAQELPVQAPPSDMVSYGVRCAAMAPDGTAYVCVADSAPGVQKESWIQTRGPAGARETLAEIEGRALALAVAPDGTLRVCCDHSVTAYSRSGKRLWHFRCPDGLGDGIAIGPDGVTYAAGWNHVYALSRSGEVVWDRNYEHSPIGAGALLVDPEGSLYVRLDFQVFAADARGKLKWVVPFPDAGTGPLAQNQQAATDIAITVAGRLYACSAGKLYAIE